VSELCPRRSEGSDQARQRATKEVERDAADDFRNGRPGLPVPRRRMSVAWWRSRV